MSDQAERAFTSIVEALPKLDAHVWPARSRDVGRQTRALWQQVEAGREHPDRP